MEIREIIDKSPLKINEDSFLTHARQVIRDNKLRAIPVVDEKNKVRGVLTRQGVLNITSNKSNVKVKSFIKKTPILTSSDSIEKTGREMIKANLETLPIVSSTHNPTLEGVVSIIDIFNSINRLNVESDELIKDIMSEKVKTVDAEMPVQRCWRKVVETGYSGFPVVKNGELVGIITRGDILEAGFARFKREDDSKQSGKNSPPTERVMSTPLFKVYKNTEVNKANRILLDKEIGRLPVVSKEDESKLIGIVDRFDILDSYLR